MPYDRITRRELLKRSVVAGTAFSILPLAGCGSRTAGPRTAQREPGAARLDPAAIRTFAAGVHGQVILPDSREYDAARTIWNPRFDKRPDMIVRCADTADVVRAVEFARARQLL